MGLMTRKLFRTEPKIKWWKSRREEQNMTFKHEVSQALAERKRSVGRKSQKR